MTNKLAIPLARAVSALSRIALQYDGTDCSELTPRDDEVSGILVEAGYLRLSPKGKLTFVQEAKPCRA